MLDSSEKSLKKKTTYHLVRMRGIVLGAYLILTSKVCLYYILLNLPIIGVNNVCSHSKVL